MEGCSDVQLEDWNMIYAFRLRSTLSTVYTEILGDIPQKIKHCEKVTILPQSLQNIQAAVCMGSVVQWLSVYF